MNKHNGTGLQRVLNAARCSVAGLGYAFHHEESFRLEMCLAIILTPIAFWLANTHIELILLLGSMLMVLMCECLNSAIEATVDRISKARHPLSKQAKDLGSAAVFMTQMLVLLCWSIIGWHNLT